MRRERHKRIGDLAPATREQGVRHVARHQARLEASARAVDVALDRDAILTRLQRELQALPPDTPTRLRLSLDKAGYVELTAAPLLHYDEGDALLTLPMIKDAVERGNHWRNDRMGAPGAFQLYDFPVIDHLHFAGLWLVGRFTGSYLTAFNVYFLLTYPLTALTTLVAFRRFGYSLAAGGAGGLLYAFLHAHAARGQEHYFLSAYWVVPLSLVLFRYVWPFWLFKDASRGDGMTRAAAYRHNRSMRIYLPGYLLKWMFSCLTAFAITSGFGSLSMAQAASEPASVDVFAIIAAGWGIVFACSVCVLFVTSYIYFYLSRNEA